MRSFHPIFGATKSIAATTTSGTVAFNAGMPQGEFQMRIYNAGADAVAVRFAVDANGTATTADLILPSGAIEVISLNNTDRALIGWACAKALTSTATVYFTPGHGI